MCGTLAEEHVGSTWRIPKNGNDAHRQKACKRWTAANLQAQPSNGLHRRSAARAFEAQPAVAIAGQWDPSVLRSEGWILAIRKDVRQFLG